MTAINGMMESIRYKAQILARTTKLESGIMDSGLPGFAIGFAIVMLFILVPVMILGMI